MIIMPIFVGEQYLLFPANTSPEEIKRKIIQRRIFARRVVATAILIIFVAMWLFVVPKIKEIYVDFGQEIPPSLQYFPFVGFILSGIGFIFSSQYHSEPKYISTKTNEGLLKVNFIPGLKEELAMLFILGISLAIIILSIILPIYSLRSSI
ncbi:hypothetical protein HY469_04240 [Candidatus Roizmanbacteria bacterium]|nr:hypothetical protein [Candidatus Roizmanbacteria bacterium]